MVWQHDTYVSVLCDIGGKIRIGSLESLNQVEVASVRDKNNHDLTLLFLSLFHYRNYRKLNRNRRSLSIGDCLITGLKTHPCLIFSEVF